MKLVLLAVLLIAIVSSLYFQFAHAVTLTVEECQGGDCGASPLERCKIFNLSTSKCYRDKNTGTFVTFSCRRHKNLTCVRGSERFDGACKGRPAAKNSVMCGSCGGSHDGKLEITECDRHKSEVKFYRKCRLEQPPGTCGRCKHEWKVYVGYCQRNPDQNGQGAFIEIDDIRECGTTAIQTTWLPDSNGCSTLIPYGVSGTESGFCQVSGKFLSRRLTCHGVDDDENEQDLSITKSNGFAEIDHRLI